MKRFLKKLVSEENWTSLARKKVVVLSPVRLAMAQRIARFVAGMPLHSQVVVKELIKPVGRMDYQHNGSKEILMAVDSMAQLRRLRSCAKEPETVRWIETFIKPGDVFYDIGANTGAYSLVASSHCGGKLTVHAFEPSFANYYYLCQNIILNDYQGSISAHMIALARETGAAVFNYQSVEAGTALHTLGAQVDYKGDSFEPVHVQRVISYSLDDLIATYNFPVPNHIKLDVDGIELEILQGAAKTLGDARLRTVLVEMCEFNVEEQRFISLLGEHGFDMWSKTAHTGGVVNCVYERTSKIGPGETG